MDLVRVSFKSAQIEVVEENQSIVVKDICNAIGIEYRRQFHKLKSDPTYQSKLVKVQTPGGMQEVFCIPLSKLNGWLFSINPNKVKPEVRARLIEYKNECFEVLHRHFNKSLHVNNQDLLFKQNAVIAAQEHQIKLLQDKRSCEELAAENKVLHVKLEALREERNHLHMTNALLRIEYGTLKNVLGQAKQSIEHSCSAIDSLITKGAKRLPNGGYTL